VERRAGHFAGAAAGAFFDIDLDFLDRFGCDIGFHCIPPIPPIPSIGTRP
jgi:hypothetical protein